MNKIVNKYLADARKSVGSGHANAAGEFNDPTNFGGNAFASAAGSRAYRNADGMGASAPTSQPYIVNVTSTSGATVSNFDILGSNEKLGSSKWNNGNYVDGNVTISSGMPGITYQELLVQLQQKPVKIALTYIQSATANQILQSIAVVTKDANGNVSSRVIDNSIDPYQQQSTVLAQKQAFNIDGNVKLTIAAVLPNATITFKFFPADKIDISDSLAYQNPQKTYSDPGIVKAQEIRLT